jgi:hypothetical protein
MGLFQGNFYDSAARTATPTPAEIALMPQVFNAELIISVTAKGAAPSVVFNLEELDAIGAWQIVLSSAAVTVVGVSFLRFGSDIASVANVAANGVLPERLRLRPVHGNSDSITYSVGFHAR